MDPKTLATLIAWAIGFAISVAFIFLFPSWRKPRSDIDSDAADNERPFTVGFFMLFFGNRFLLEYYLRENPSSVLKIFLKSGFYELLFSILNLAVSIAVILLFVLVYERTRR